MLDHLLKEFKGVFPAELPKHVTPDRGLGDVHEITVKPGTEYIARKYQRSGFWYQREAEASNRAQVLWKNTVVVDDAAVLLAMLRVPRTMWRQITFVVKDVAMMQRIQSRVPGTCWHCGYVTTTGKVLCKGLTP